MQMLPCSLLRQGRKQELQWFYSNPGNHTGSSHLDTLCGIVVYENIHEHEAYDCVAANLFNCFVHERVYVQVIDTTSQ